MTDEHRSWGRQREVFWRAHHEGWQRSDLNQREYCEAHNIPLKAFGNWRAKFQAEPRPPERKLLYRRHALSPPLSPPVRAKGPVLPGDDSNRRAGQRQLDRQDSEFRMLVENRSPDVEKIVRNRPVASATVRIGISIDTIW